MRFGHLPGGSPLPVVLTPERDRERRIDHLLGCLDEAREEVAATLHTRGALLLRGFALHDAHDFQRVVRLLAPAPSDYTRGISPRTRVAEGVYTSTELPRFFPIPQHNEMSYTSRWPRQVVFFCETPSPHGGETPLADMRRVHADVDPAVRERFERLGVRIIQNVPRRPRLFEPKGWPEMFGTDDAELVLATCRAQGIDATLQPDGTLRLIEVTPGVLRHPVTGEPCWFNSATTFHDSFSRELWRERILGLGTAVAALEVWRRLRVPDEACTRHCTFGDGAPISVAVMEHIRAVHRRHTVAFPWAAGDLLLLDNVLVSHGRRPFRGSRRVLAALVPHDDARSVHPAPETVPAS